MSASGHHGMQVHRDRASPFVQVGQGGWTGREGGNAC